MGRQHRSSKLLNKASNTGGKLTLFTELNHTFQPGDLLYINGGYYDNTTEVMYNSTWLINSSLFTNKAYKVLSINNAQNSITLDYNVTIPTPFFPYCSKTVTTNTTANPDDVLDIAYSSFNDTLNGDSMYFEVYISQLFNGKTRVARGNINNGIFGTDKILNHIGKKITDFGNPSYKSLLNINHICAKRISVDYGIVNSKSFDNEITTRFGVNIYSPTYNLSSIVIGNNNDSQGYSYFQTSFFGSINSGNYTDIELKKSKIGNGGYYFNSGCYITKALITGAQIGTDRVSKNNSTILEDCKIINNSVLRNVQFEYNLLSTLIEDSHYDSSISTWLTTSNLSTGIVYDGVDTITFTGIDSANFVSNKLEFSASHKFYITGIKDKITNDIIHYLNDLCYITSFSNTFGAWMSGIISIKFSQLTSNSADFITNYTSGPGPLPGTYYVKDLHLDNLLLFQGGINDELAVTNIKVPNIYAYTNTINLHGIFTNDVTTPLGRINIIANIGTTNVNCMSGYYNQVNVIDTVHFPYGNNKILKNVYQLLPSSYNSQIEVENVIFKEATNSDRYTYTYMNIVNSIILNGNFSNSKFTNTNIKEVGANSMTFLYNSSIIGSSIVDDNIKWEYIKYTPNNITYSLNGLYYKRNKSGYFQGKKSNFIIGNSNQTINSNTTFWNLNGLKNYKTKFYYSRPLAIAPSSPYNTTTGDDARFNTVYKYNNTNVEILHNKVVLSSLKLVPIFRSFFSSINFGQITPSGIIAYINLGQNVVTTSVPFGYLNSANTNHLMLADKFNVNTTLQNAIINASNNITTPLSNPIGTGTIDSSMTLTDSETTFSVRSNAIYNIQNYHYYDTSGTITIPKRYDYLIWTNNNLTSNTYIDSNNKYPTNIITTYEAVGATSSTIINLTTNGTTVINETLLNEGGYEINLIQTAWFVLNITLAEKVVRAYIDIDSIIVEEYDNFNGNILTQPNVFTNITHPDICNSVTALYNNDNSLNVYDRTITYSADTSFVNYKPLLYKLVPIINRWYKIEINLGIYFNYLGVGSQVFEDSGKYEIRKHYLWLQII